MQALIVEVDEYGVYPLQDAVDGSVMEVEEAKRPAMAYLSLNVRRMKHTEKVQDVRIQVNTIYTICHITRQVCEVRVANVFLDFDGVQRKLQNLRVNPFRCPFLIPAACCHFCS